MSNKQQFCLILTCFFALCGTLEGSAQCGPASKGPLSQRPANYEINVTLDHQTHMIRATQRVSFTNHSPQPIEHLRFYMYLNAFKNTESTFLKGVTKVFGRDYTNRRADEWGWLDIQSIKGEDGVALQDHMRYVQPDDGNSADQSVLDVPLAKPIAPGQTAVFDLTWTAKMPKTIARAGYSKDFYLFVHWFPQLGVFEQNRAGEWDWNCHQFFRTTEFYADFGVYDVHITADRKFVMGASGCLIEERQNPDGTSTRHYRAEDVIDFAWSVYPGFEEINDRWQDVQIKLLVPKEHSAMAPRYLYALRFALDYMEKHVGKYHYPSITVVDPPFHGLRSGLMEYPTLITTGTFYGIPKNIRTSESLIIHEFVHQYFMAMVASNEKEQAWLDEGFVTYYEDRIIDEAFGPRNALVNVAGYGFNNKALSRVEYTTMRNPREGIVDRPGWYFSDGNFKPLIYSKTATTLRTVESLVGTEKFDGIMRAYFEKWKFRHPRGEDFMAALQDGLRTSVTDSVYAGQIYELFVYSITEARVLDYAVSQITNEMIPAPQGIYGEASNAFTLKDGQIGERMVSKVVVQRNGDWIFPVDLLVTFDDGTTELLHWSGDEGRKVFEFSNGKQVISAQLDPNQKLHLDIDLNNNSYTLQPATAPLWKYTSKVFFWLQNMMQVFSFLS